MTDGRMKNRGNGFNRDTWTPERIEQLTELWDEGITTAEMGRRMGLTKNQVIGKVQRLNLAPRVITVAKVRRELYAATRALSELKAGSCVWPFGDPRADGFHFCGARTPGGGVPYCEDHVLLAYMKPRKTIEEIVKGETNHAA